MNSEMIKRWSVGHSDGCDLIREKWREGESKWGGEEKRKTKV